MSAKIAIQGIKGCFHEMAARKYFTEDIHPVECHSFKDVCISVQSGASDYAIMAIENTLAGSLLPNYTLMQKYNLHIVGEVYLPIRMNLMSVEGASYQSIRTVMSHPVALAQCEEFLEKLGAEVVEYHDTAAASKFVSEKKDPTWAAISNELSAEIYALNIVERGIETHKENFTRFLILASSPHEGSDANKASLSLILSHKPGSLADVLQIFKMYEVNLTKIQSLPIIGKPYQYAFKMDITWLNRESFEHSLRAISSMGNEVEIRGIYKEQNYQL